MNYKRKHPRRQVRCTLCTQHRWKGNSCDRHKVGEMTEEAEESKLLPAPTKTSRVKKPYLVEARIRDPKDTMSQFWSRRYSDWATYRRFDSERAARQSLSSHKNNQLLSRVLEFRVVYKIAS